MFLYLAPKKTGGSGKKSQQARDREAREAENTENVKAAANVEKDIDVEAPVNGGLLANAKISAEALKKLTETDD
jgi:translation initiation factor IF-3